MTRSRAPHGHALAARVFALALVLAGCAPEPVAPFDPRSVEASIPDVIAALRAGSPADALEAIDRHAASGRPLDGLEHYRGLALADAGRTEEALAAFRAEIAEHPGDGRAHGMAADALLELGRLDEAAVHLEQCRLYASDFPYAVLLTGRHALLVDDDARALDAFSTYLELDRISTRAAEAHHALAQIATRAGLEADASRHARASQRLERIHQFLNRYRDRLAADPADADAALGVGMIYLDLFTHVDDDPVHLAEAERALTVALRLAPDNVRALFNMGFVRTVQDRGEEALGFYEQTLALDAGHVGALLNAGVLARRMGQLARSLEWLQRGLALATEPADVERALYELGRLFEELQRPDDAGEHYRRFLALPPAEARDAAERLAGLTGG